MSNLSPRAAKARFEGNASLRWRRFENKRQQRVMTIGPRILADGHTLVVPSEWYHEEAKEFWKQHGFRYVPGLSWWERDVRHPLHSSGKRYSAEAWLESTRRVFYEFWPALMKVCPACGQQFKPRSIYDIQCKECREQKQQEVR